MNKLAVVSPMAAIAVIGFAVMASQNGVTSHQPSTRQPLADPVLASFERELNHEPMPAQPAQGDSIETDVLYQTVNSVHWTKDKKAVE